MLYGRTEAVRRYARGSGMEIGDSANVLLEVLFPSIRMFVEFMRSNGLCRGMSSLGVMSWFKTD